MSRTGTAARRSLPRIVEDACVLEAAARKPGNVHPTASFAGLGFEDFVRSARAIAGPLAGARRASLGRAVLDATRAMRRAADTNVHLGTILLLAPLCAMPRTLLRHLEQPGRRAALRSALRERIGRSTRRDAELVYEAIRLARPAGLGEVEEGGIAAGPSGTLLEMMRLSERRDLVARELTRGYPEVLGSGVPIFLGASRRGLRLEDAIVSTYLRLLARRPDTHIARKCGAGVALDVQKRASAALAVSARRPAKDDVPVADWPEIRRLDRWLRADGHRRNPGSTADVIAAVVFLALASDII